MNIYEQRLSAYLQEQHIQAEHLSFDQPCHSVAEAARAVDASPQELVKNICLLDSDGQLITAIVKGEDRVSVSRIAKTLQKEGLRLATPAEISEKRRHFCQIPFRINVKMIVFSILVRKQMAEKRA